MVFDKWLSQPPDESQETRDVWGRERADSSDLLLMEALEGE
jgi:hypothetical protein